MNARTLAARAGLALAAAGTLGLAACTPPNEQPSTAGSSSASSSRGAGGASQSPAPHDHSAMSHPADGGPAPAGIREAANPAFPVGSRVTLAADHMPGMEGADATVAGAYDTYTYAVSYTPTDGGAPVVDHKWVVQEEIEGSGSERLADGTEVVLTADHMPGMRGATATVVSSTDQPVYMVDYEAGGMTMTNHKWVVEDEIR